jgi:Carboxypeptidase regulatory-like domain
MLRRIVLLIITIPLAGQLAAAQVASAQMNGAIQDEMGRPLAGARVVYTRNTRLVHGKDGKYQDAPGESRFSAQVTTDAIGRYQVPNLPPGDYDLCSDAPGYLATCEWTGWRRASVAQAQVLENGAMQLTKGVTVNIRINDPLSLLKGANTIASPLVVGVRDRSGRLHPGRETPVSGGSHVFQVDVPYGTALNVWLHSWRFLLTNSTGAAMNRLGAQVPFQVAVNGTAPTFVFNIAGEVKP